MNIFSHFFTPHKSNNHRAKFLHTDVIFLIAIIFFFSSFALSYVKNNYPNVLGLSINISSTDLLLLTNQQRMQNGFAPLSYNTDLANAASLKADDMFANNYWAHISPTGVTPWDFIQKEGYRYTYAGENLARGFTSATDVMNAWMNSPEHRANILSPNYQDVGFAIKTGSLTGEKDTVLIVEMFGGKGQSPLNNNSNLGKNVIATVYAGGKNNLNSMVSAGALIDRFNFSKNLSQILIIIFIVVLVLDVILVRRKKIYRLTGHNLDHILFLSAILAFILLLTAGSISL